ncbi:MAG: sulfatase-like hydrolase/transferase [Planctomycetes bacterium]|nr:sulfatase-like hydrolase/transferase [Planctomycetota bacterium]
MFLKTIGICAASFALPSCAIAEKRAGKTPVNKPNIILCMTDDQGWGDTGYNGHPVLKTPSLDAMSREGIRFDRFYAGAPVCSPTRGSAITGRHPYRYGIFYANKGHMRKEEVTLAEALKTVGYTTGHFGKWHLGTLTTEIKDSNRGAPGKAQDYSPPWQNGFDECFSTEAKVPTYDPMKAPGSDEPYGTYYWKTDGTRETENLEGDDSRIIMDRAIPFIDNAARSKQPFLAVIWFHAPHLPVLAGPEHRKPYADQPESKQHYYGAITAMDEQVGRLRKELKTLGVADDTLLWFCSDNGPEGKSGKAPGSAGHLRGRKRSLFEGGVRVPGLFVWPAKVKKPRVVDIPCSTLDYFPTVMEILGFRVKGQPEPIDGVSLLPLIEGKMKQRPTPIGFESAGQVALIDNRYKIHSANRGKSFRLYDLIEDPAETTDLAAAKPDIVSAMKQTLLKWRASCKNSLDGKDYMPAP